jgi:hypothetical protein
MDNEQAKLILAAFRPDGRDANDPDIADAMRQAEMDPELRRWLAEQRAFDQRMMAGLECVQPPAGARDRALAAIRVSQRWRARWTWAWAWPLAMAASVALVATVTTVVVRQPERVDLPQLASTEGLAGYLAEHDASIGLMNEDYQTLVNWIEARGGPKPESVPAPLAQLPVLGCQTWNTDRGTVSLVCFVGPDRTRLHLYVFEDTALLPGTLPQRSEPRIERHGVWAMAGWQHGGKGYVLGIPADGDAAAAVAPFIEV